MTRSQWVLFFFYFFFLFFTRHHGSSEKVSNTKPKNSASEVFKIGRVSAKRSYTLLWRVDGPVSESSSSFCFDISLLLLLLRPYLGHGDGAHTYNIDDTHKTLSVVVYSSIVPKSLTDHFSLSSFIISAFLTLPFNIYVVVVPPRIPLLFSWFPPSYY